MKLEEIADLVGGTVRGDGALEIQGVAGIEDAREDDITFVTQKKYVDSLKRSKAAAVLVAREIDTGKAQVITANPTLAFARLLNTFHPPRPSRPGIDDRAVIGENVMLGQNVTLSPFVWVGNNVTIGDHTVLHPGVVVGDDSQIGHHTTLHPQVTLYPETVVGNHVILHAGVVVGADGFGYTPDEQGRHYKIPQVGRVILEDHVEVGANTCIDRATQGATRIGEGTKIDNLVQVAHNCTLGDHSILVAQVGLAGSCTLGHHVTLAGQVGLADHVTIGPQAILAAQSGTFRDIEEKGVYGGSPSVPLNTWKKYVTVLPKLPDLTRKVKDLEARLNAIENK